MSLNCCGMFLITAHYLRNGWSFRIFVDINAELCTSVTNGKQTIHASYQQLFGAVIIFLIYGNCSACEMKCNKPDVDMLEKIQETDNSDS